MDRNRPNGQNERNEHHEPNDDHMAGYKFVKPLKQGDEAPDPFEINFLPQFLQGRGPRQPFVNEYGVVIGDHMYESSNSPLQQWSKDTDPAVMSGDQWVHPFKDIGFHTEENREYFEEGVAPSGLGSRFMHPDKDVAYEHHLEGYDGEEDEHDEDGESGRE